MFNHIMLDLETLDTGPRSVVTSIGAVAFDPHVSGPAGLGDKFYVELTDDLSIQQQCGRTISGDTVVWWMRQGQAAQQLFEPRTNEFRVGTVRGLNRFAEFICANGARDVQLWGNGADFDNIILGSLYEDLGMKKPWSYSRNRCFRTMKNLRHSKTIVRPPRTGTHHNALDDAITQAEHLQAIYQRLFPQ